MAAATDHVSLIRKCRDDVAVLLSSLHTLEDEDQWTELINNIQTQSGETKWGVLYVLKAVILRTETVMAVKNLMQIFVRKMCSLIAEFDVLKSEVISAEFLAVLKDFWALCSNQHHTLTKLIFGTYTADLYDVLPSLASLYIDLFVASNSSKEKTELLSRRLHGWLNFELNERCLKTALLEVSTCTPKAASFLLPLLKEVLMSPPPERSFMDYLLHFLVLRRWSPLSSGLSDVVEMNLNVKSPKNFVDWLSRRWANTREHLPQDKSLKGRRVSELLCSLDSEIIEELIDVFSECLLSAENQESETEPPGGTEAAAANLFVIDKTGSERDGVPPKKKQKLDTGLKSPTNSTGTSNGAASLPVDNNDDYNKGVTVKHKVKKAKEVTERKKKDARVDEASALGFVLDRAPSKAKKLKNEKNRLVLVEEGREETRANDGDDGSIDDDSNIDFSPKVVDEDSDNGVEDNNAADGDSNNEERSEHGENVLDSDGKDGADVDDSEAEVIDSNDDADDSKAEVFDSNDDSEADVIDSNDDSEAEVIDSNDDADDFEAEVIDSNDDSEAEVIDSNDDSEADVIDSNDDADDSEAEVIDSNDDADDSEGDVHDINENGDNEDDENSKDTSGGKDKNARDSKATSKTPAPPTLFPSSVKDPALSYFVNTSQKKINSLTETDAMEITVIQSFDSGNDIPANVPSKKKSDDNSSISKQALVISDTAASDNGSSRKRKRKFSKSEQDTITSEKAKPGLLKQPSVRENVVESSDGEKSRRSKRLRTESGSSLSGAVSHTDTPSGKSSLRGRTSKASEACSGQTDLKQADNTQSNKQELVEGPAKSPLVKITPLDMSGLTDEEKKTEHKTHFEMGEESSHIASESGDFTDGDIVKHGQNRRRLRSESESSHSKITITDVSSVGRSHNTRRLKTLSESHSDSGKDKNEGSGATIKQKEKSIETKVNSPNKKSEKDWLDEKSNTETDVETPKEARTDVTTTEEQVSFVLSQIRQSLSDDVSQTGKTRTTRATTRLRAASESFDSKTESKANTTVRRRQTLTGIKGKEETSKTNKNQGSTNLLMDWLRKPRKDEVTAEKEKMKSADEREADKIPFLTVHELESDNEVAFNPNTVGETYAKREARSPKRLLIESKGEKKSSESPKSKSPEKSLKNISQGKRQVTKAESSPHDVLGNVRDDTADEESEIIKTPKATTSIKETIGPVSRRRKYYLRGTSPVKSPTEEINKSQTEKTLPTSSPTSASSTSLSVTKPKSSPHKSPADRRKSLRSSSKQSRS